jgi:hypothetical protein
MLKFLKIAWMFAVPIGCAIVSLFFFWYAFFRFDNYIDRQSLVLAIVGTIAGIIWFRALYKGYKLMKAGEKRGAATPIGEDKKTVPAASVKAAELSAAQYWKRFTIVVIVLFVIGLLIRYFFKF